MSLATDVLTTRLLAVADGDAAEFAALYVALSARVRGAVLRVLRDPDLADEVTQDVFITAWETADRFDAARGSASSWLLTIAHHRAVDRVRREESGRRRAASYAGFAGTALPFDSTAASADNNREGLALRRAVALLTPMQRQAIELAYFGGYSYAEAAVLLCVPLGTFKTRIRDGFAVIRSRMLHPALEPG